jgi:hypothetical protein
MGVGISVSVEDFNIHLLLEVCESNTDMAEI